MTSSPSVPSVKSVVKNSAPVQRKLVLDDTPALVLATVSDARLRLPGHDEDDIALLIEENFLIAWNIASPSAAARELRLLPQSIDLYAKAGHKSLKVVNGSATNNPFRQTWPQLLLGRHHDKPFLLSTTIKLLLNCGATHVIDLIRENQLAQLKGTEFTVGPNGAACITRESFLAFLKARLL